LTVAAEPKARAAGERRTGMREVVSDPKLVAYCGLYCGACGSYLKDKCPGCHDKKNASWCKVRKCCLEHQYLSCAECKEFADPRACKNFNNFMSKLIGFLLRSDRAACIEQIGKVGIQGHAEEMTRQRRQTIRK
jgi:hypothetical protein